MWFGQRKKKKTTKFDSKILVHPLRMLNEELISVMKRLKFLHGEYVTIFGEEWLVIK